MRIDEINKELLPCPFCGGKVKLIGISDEFFTIVCYECNAHIKVNSIRSWNTRVELKGGYANKDERFIHYHGIQSD